MKMTKRISYAALILLVMAFTAVFRSDALAMLRETEPNNTFSQANEFQLNGAEFAGQLYSTSDVDVFKFNVSTQGVLSFSMRPENSNYDGGVVRVLLKDSNSNVLAGRDLKSDSTIVNLYANIATLGYYYLVVDQKPGYQIFDKDYQITPNILTDPFSINHREIEPNNSFSQANSYLTNGETYSGQLSSTSDVDVFEFYASGQGVLSFSIKPENNHYDGGVIRVTIKNSSSTILAGKDLVSDSTGIDLNANVSTAGYYYLVVDQKPGYQIFDKDYQITPNIEVVETITIPNILTGPINGTTGVSYSYTTGGSTSNLGHSVEYQFDWGDGTYSAWGSGTQSKIWTLKGAYSVTARARCATHHDVTSSWSSPISVAIFTLGIYVGHDGLCGSKSLCFTSIQNGIDSAQSFTIIEITQETYNENIILDEPKMLIIQGGWDAAFSTNQSYTIINGSVTISDGKVIVENIVLQ